MMTSEELKDKFKNPPFEYGPMPFWFMNNDLSPESLQGSLEEQQRKGVAGVFMHPRTGMEVEYLSDQFWRGIQASVEKAKELEMQAWMYDEYNWPSGPVGGKLLREYPEYRQTYLDYITVKAKRGFTCEASLPDDAELVLAVAIEEGDDRRIDLGERVSSDNTFRWKPSDGSWQVIVFFTRVMPDQFFSTGDAPWAKAERGYLDLLNPAAVRKFMDYTHEEYAKRFSEEFGNTIPGIFTDEPANYRGLQWTKNFLEEFKKRKGYDLLDKMHELVLSRGDYIKTRCDYHQIALELYTEAFFQQIRRWCDEKGLKFTGHLLLEEDLTSLPNQHGGFYATIGEMNVPGIDYLGDKSGYDPMLASLGFNVGPKQLSSTAHAKGADRTLCEIFGGCGWDTTLEKLKDTTNWALATGVNLFNPHASFVSLKGLRKRDFPATHFVQAPWWKYYDKFSAYISRNSYLVSQGIHIADILLFYPMSSMWAEHTLYNKSDSWKLLKNSFTAISDGLLHIQRDYDYLFEEVVLEGKAQVEEDALRINQERFRAVILPPIKVIPTQVLELLRDFYKAGGIIIALGSLPSSSPEKENDPRIAELIGEIFGRRAKRLLGKKDGTREYIIRERDEGGCAIYLSGVDVDEEAKAEKILTEVLNDYLPADLAIETEDRHPMVYLHRRIDDTDFYFVANLSSKQIKARISLRAKGRVEIWHADTGEIQPAYAYETDDNNTYVPYTFPPHEALYLVISPQEEAPHISSTNIAVTEVTSEGVEGYSRLDNPFIRVGEEFLTVTTDTGIIEAIVLPNTWNIELKQRNVFMLEPWTIVAAEEIKKEEEIGSVWEMKELSFRAKLTTGILGAISRLKEQIGPRSKKLAISRYTSIFEFLETMDKIPTMLGINIEDMGISERLSLFSEISKRAGLGITEIYPPPGSEYEITTSFNVSYIPEDIGLVYEDLGEPIEITLNSTRIDEQAEDYFLWDKCNKRIALKDHLTIGENKITIKTRMPAFHSQFPSTHGIEPIALEGSFMVKGNKVVEFNRQLESGDLTKQGLPNYSGEITYRQSFILSSGYLDKRLMLEFEDVRNTAEVLINGQKADVCLWSPYVLDITSFVTEGENKLEIIVTNTSANMLGKPVPTGIMGKVSIVPYNKHTAELK